MNQFIYKALNDKEIENLLEDNYKKLCEKSEELKQAISQKVDYEKNFVSAKEKVEQLDDLVEKMDEFYREVKRKFFLRNLKNFICLNYLSVDYRKKLIKEINDTYFHTTNIMLRKKEFLVVSGKMSEVGNEMKKIFSEKFFIYDELVGEVSGTRDKLLFEAMLETGKNLNDIEKMNNIDFSVKEKTSDETEI